MLKKFLFMSLTVLVILTYFSDNSAKADIDATFWAPGEVLLKEKYHGLIILDTKTAKNTTFEIITNNEEVLKITTDVVTIPKGKHHGLVQFETIGSGDATIYAISQNVLLEEQVNVVESADAPSEIDLILPSDLINVLTDENIHTGYVFLLNDFKNPVSAGKQITVALTSNGEIELPQNSVVIQPEDHYAKFSFRALGEGSISASAQNLIPDEETINLEDPEDIELQIAVGPDPVPTESTGEIYFWLERDGNPFIPTHDVKIEISIDKSSNLSFDSSMRGAIVLTPNTADRRADNSEASKIITKTEDQLSFDSERTFVIKKGEHFGRLTAYSSFDSISDITISGVAESSTAGDREEIVKASNTISTSTESSSNEIASETKVFVFPNPAYKTAEIIVSSYSDEGPVIELDEEEFTVFTDNKLQLEKNSGIIQTDKNYEIIPAKVIDFGTAEIFAERNEVTGEEITLETSGKYVKDPELNIVTLPIIYGVEQDLFLVSSSQEKIITDIGDEEGNLISITSRPSFDYKVIRESESVISIVGKISEILENDPEVYVSSNAFTVEDTLDVHNPGRNILVSLHPEKAYPRESFPIINHVADLNSNPIKKSSLKVSSTANMGTDNNLFYFNQTGTHDIIFFDRNSVPIKSTIQIMGAQIGNDVNSNGLPTVTVTKYDIIVNDGQGSGLYEEGEEVTISADPVIDDSIIIKKNFVGWENLPYKTSTVTFEADEEIETRPIYQEDFSLLILIIGVVVGTGAIVIIRKRTKGKPYEDEDTKEDELLELLKD